MIDPRIIKSPLTNKIYICNDYDICKKTNKIIAKSKRDITDKFIEWTGDKRVFSEFFEIDLKIEFDRFYSGKFWINGKEAAEKGDIVGKVNGKFWIIYKGLKENSK